MKKVILGSIYILSGILFTLVSLLKIDESDLNGMAPILLIIGIALFLIGSVLGIAGILDDK